MKTLFNNSKAYLLSMVLCCSLVLVACNESGSSSSGSGDGGGSGTGRGGSTARMTIVNNYLYAIAGTGIQLFDVSNPATPNPWTNVNVAWDIQTIFPYQNYLLIGAADGVYILDNTDQAAPYLVGEFTHATVLDPVVAQEGYAYVTLKSDFSRPNGFIDDQMNVVDISDVSNTNLVKTIPMQAPEGLTVVGNELFVCDGVAGIKHYDLSNPADPVIIDNIPRVDCNDVIAVNGILYVITDTSLQQYDYSVSPPYLLSTIETDASLLADLLIFSEEDAQ